MCKMSNSCCKVGSQSGSSSSSSSSKIAAPKPIPCVILNDGNKFPLIGYGTSHVVGAKPGDPGYDAIITAIRSGYRFLDTAALYKNEESVGAAVGHCIEQGLVRRKELFICTKVWNTAHKRESVMRACKDSLKKLRLDYVDLYLIHWPTAYAEHGDPVNPKDPDTGRLLYSDTHYTETWLGMQDVKDAGLARSIGVSNFNHQMIDDIIAMPCKHRPTVNQIECHAYLSQEKLLRYSQSVGVHLNAYCPLGSPGSCAGPDQPPVLQDPLVCELASKYRKSGAQILIRYLVQRQISAIPKSITEHRIRENLDVLDFEISSDDMERLLGINRNLRYCLNTAGEYVDDHPLYPFHLDY